MKIAYLFLTYDNLLHKNEILDTIHTDHIYIHPKFPEKVDSDLAKYIIPHCVPTSWGNISIVRATLNLLREAYHDRTNKWFVLMSQDCYPVASYTDIHNLLNAQQHSIFDMVGQDHDIYKTSQWWAMTRADVEIVLRYYGKFDAHHHSFSPKKFIRPIFEFAFDEIYFLSLLRWVNPNYEFTQGKTIYTRWLHNVNMHHPVLFNKLTQADMSCILQNNSMFIRKTTANFQKKIENVGDEDYALQSKTRLLMYLYITEKRDLSYYQTVIDTPSIDIVCIVHYHDHIPPELLAKSLHVIQLPYKYSYGVFLDIYYSQSDFWKHWGGVWFVYPGFNMTADGEYQVYNNVRIPLYIPKGMDGFRPGQELPNTEAFYYLEDKHGRVAYSLTTVQL